MNRGIAFCELLTRALKQEEADLKILSKSRQTVTSIHAYYESWLSVPLLKQMTRDDSPFKLDWEHGKTDIHFLEGEHYVAAFELKGPFDAGVSHQGYLKAIRKDLRNLSVKSRNDSSMEYYLVLVPWGRAEELIVWNEQKLRELVGDDCPDTAFREVAKSDFIQLNDKIDEYAVVKTFLVASR
jgi:hypothetical protein